MKSVVVLLLMALQISTPCFNEVAHQTFGHAQLLVAADLDGNKTTEVVIWDAQTQKVICYDYICQRLWELEVAGPVITGAADDIDEDGSKEVFLLEEQGGDTFYGYRIIRVEHDGNADWRKYIEISVKSDLTFYFINADGKPGKEIAVANRILLGEGLERLAFGWDRIIVGVAHLGGEPYFLVYLPKESLYELYSFSEEPLWKGKPCEQTQMDASMQLLICTLFMDGGVCSCLEDWPLKEAVPIMKGIRLWSDITGDGKEEAVYVTDSAVSLIDCQGDTLWTWQSPEPIQECRVQNIVGDASSEILVFTASRGAHVPSLYVLRSTGVVESVYALNLSGTPTVFFSDMDGDNDLDLLTFDEKKRGSSLRIYANTSARGPLDTLEPLGSLEEVNPSSMKTRFWTFYAAHGAVMAVVLVVAIAGTLFVVRKVRSKSQT